MEPQCGLSCNGLSNLSGCNDSPVFEGIFVSVFNETIIGTLGSCTINTPSGCLLVFAFMLV